MPEYSFECGKCQENFTEIFTMSEYDDKISKVKCPECNSSEVFRDFNADQIVTNYIGGLHEAKTLGEYADKQTKKMSRDQVADKIASFKTKKNPNSGMKELPTGMSRGGYTEAPRPERKRK